MADRFDSSEQATGSLANAVFEMTGWIDSAHKKLVITADFMHKKLESTRLKPWEQDKAKRNANVEHLQCFSFDGKKNYNATIRNASFCKIATQRVFMQLENVAIMQHPQLEPLGFISILNGTATFIFEELWTFLNPCGTKKFDRLVAIAADGTNTGTNTGADGGVVKNSIYFMQK